MKIFVTTKPNNPQPGKVSTQVRKISFITEGLRLLLFFENPHPIIAVVFVWVVETGSPKRVQKRSIREDAISAEKP